MDAIKRTFDELRPGDRVLFDSGFVATIKKVEFNKVYSRCEFTDGSFHRFYGLVTCVK